MKPRAWAHYAHTTAPYYGISGLAGPGRSVTRRRTTHANTARSQFTSASIAPESSQGTCVCCSKLLRRAAAAQQAAPLCEMWSCLPRLPHLPPLRLILLLPRCLDVGRRHATPPPSGFPSLTPQVTKEPGRLLVKSASVRREHGAVLLHCLPLRVTLLLLFQPAHRRRTARRFS